MKLSEIITNKGKGRGNLLVLWGGKCKKEPVRRGTNQFERGLKNIKGK